MEVFLLIVIIVLIVTRHKEQPAQQGVHWQSPERFLSPDPYRERYMKQRWRAKSGDIYWTVNDHGDIIDQIENRARYNDQHHASGNYYRTLELAREAAERVRRAYVA